MFLRNIILLKLVVENFQIKDANGKKVHIFDHLNTRVNDDAVLKYLITSMPESLVLKVQFKSTDSEVFITSEVFFVLIWIYH